MYDKTILRQKTGLLARTTGDSQWHQLQFRVGLKVRTLKY